MPALSSTIGRTGGFGLLQRLVLAAIALFALMLPVLANGTVLLFPDSLGYFSAGESALETVAAAFEPAPTGGTVRPPRPRAVLLTRAGDGIAASRSVYYGVPLVTAYRLGNGIAVALFASALTLVSLYMALAHLAGFGARRATLAIVVLATVGGISMFTSVMMPDIMSGLMLLALAMLLTHRPTMRHAEQLWWLAMVLGGVLVHKSNLAVAVILAGLYLVLVLARRVPLRPILPVLAILAAGLGAHALVFAAVTRIAGKPPVEAPFVLARIVGDGTAERYLDSACADVDFALCRYRNRLPMTENQFLWSHNHDRGIMAALPRPEVDRIVAEANAVILASVAHDPVHQLVASMVNLARQFFTVGVTEYALGPLRPPTASPILEDLLTAYPATPAGRHHFPFGAISAVMLVAYVAALLVVATGLVHQSRQPRDARASARRAAVLWLLAGLVANAAVTGMIAGVFDRYQGRVAWLAILAAIVTVATRRSRETAP